MKLDELLKTLYEADLIMRPFAILCSPQNAEIIKSHFEETYEIIVSDLVESDKVYVINRKEIDPLYIPEAEHMEVKNE